MSDYFTVEFTGSTTPGDGVQFQVTPPSGEFYAFDPCFEGLTLDLGESIPLIIFMSVDDLISGPTNITYTWPSQQPDPPLPQVRVITHASPGAGRLMKFVVVDKDDFTKRGETTVIYGNDSANKNNPW